MHPNGRIYEGTYDNPSGDTVALARLRVPRRRHAAALVDVQGQDLSQPHGVQVGDQRRARAASSCSTRAPPRALLLDARDGRADASTRRSRPASIPNYAAWGPDGSLYVTDYGQPIIWRVPPGGGAARGRGCTTRGSTAASSAPPGIALAADRKTLLVATQSEAGGAAGNPTTGRLWTVPIDGDKPGEMKQLWESRPVDGPDGFAIARSGNVYVALLAANQIAVVGPDGAEIERFPQQPGTGDNGSEVPFDSPSSARFLGHAA